MKIIYLFLVLQLLPMTVSSQILGFGWLSDQFPITSLTSTEYAIWAGGKHGIIKSQEERVVRSLQKLQREYKNRYGFYAADAIASGFFNVIEDTIDEVQTRIATLKATNTTTTFYFPYKKQQNLDALEEVEAAVNNFDSNIKTGLLSPMTGGEKLNLKQNLELSLETWSRRLDDIESNINKGQLLNALVISLKD